MEPRPSISVPKQQTHQRILLILDTTPGLVVMPRLFPSREGSFQSCCIKAIWGAEHFEKDRLYSEKCYGRSDWPCTTHDRMQTAARLY
jgi:hypothetical protein